MAGTRSASQHFSCSTRLPYSFIIQSFLVEFPRAIAAVGPDSEPPRVLFDPIFSDYAGPSPWIGVRRRLPPPCTIEELPEFQFVVYSHNQCVVCLGSVILS